MKIYKNVWLMSVCFFLVGIVSAYAQKQPIRGKITDEGGSPLPGVNILIKGTTVGTTSDANGEYALEAASNDVLVVSFIGYQTKEVQVGTQSQLDLAMAEDVATLSEVVVVGYGEQKKKLVTGANVQVSGETLQKQNQINPLQALQGQAPGVSIAATSGQPGSDMKVTVRGLGTIGNGGPLYVIDGIPNGDISILNPNDIKSIDVLKDAASAAIYGAQAANGVVLVTTKQGSAGKGQVTFDAYTGWQNVNRKADMLNADEYKMIMNEQALNSGNAPLDFGSMGELANTNWMDYMFKDNARTSNYSLGINGGSEKSTYAISLGYLNQEGIVGGKAVSDYERYSFRINTEHKLYGDVLKIGQHLNFNYISNVGINVGNQYNNTLRGAFGTSPLSPVYSDNNPYEDNPYNDTSNSLWYKGDGNPYGFMMTSVQNRNNAQKLLADIYAELEPIKNLRLRSVFGINYSSSQYRSYTPRYHFSIYSYNDDHTTVLQNANNGHTLLFTNTATYDRQLGDHAFGVMVGMESQQYQGSNLQGTNWNLLSQFNDFAHAYLSNTTSIAHKDKDGNVVQTAFATGKPDNNFRRASYFGRLTYNYKEKYLLNATLRADGSSRFAKGHRWGYFPSVSGGWVISYEDFAAGMTDFVNFFKLRASWGQVGSQDIDDFQFAAPINTSTNISDTNPAAFYTFGTGGANIAGAYQTRFANPNVKWETSEQTDIGFDAKVMNNRLDIAFDYYSKTTKDWLVTAPILATAGAKPPVINGGSVKNKGVELALNWNDHVGELKYQLGVNGAYNKNTVGDIPTADHMIHGDLGLLFDNSEEFYRAENGHPIGYFWGYKTAGIFQSEADILAWKEAGNGVLQADVKPGDVKYVDQDHDGRIDAGDKVDLGSGMAKTTFGFNIGAQFRGFDLQITAYGAAGNKIVQSYRNQTNMRSNYTSAILDRWTGEGTSNRMPRVTESNINWQFSDLYVHDGDYLRISNISLGYDLAGLIKWNYLSRMRVYVQGQNLFTFTKYDGMDPEIGYGTQKWVSGVDLGYYPRPKIMMVGVNMKF